MNERSETKKSPKPHQTAGKSFEYRLKQVMQFEDYNDFRADQQNPVLFADRNSFN